MKNNENAGEALDLNKLQKLADRIDARGLFNASCDLREWIEEARAAVEADRAQRPENASAELIAAADATVERWHSRDWKQPHTADFIARLAAAVGAAKAADRAQQGEPVACKGCDPAEGFCRACREAEQQEMVVRVAPAPAGQHDADFAALTDEEIDLIVAKHSTRLSGWEWSGELVEVNGFREYELAREIEAVVARRCRAQRTTIDNENCRAAPVPDTGIPTADCHESCGHIGAECDFPACKSGRAPVSGTPTSEAVETDAARYRWIEENARTEGGGHGFTITAFVPFDEEDMGCGIDKAIEVGAAPAHPGEGGSK